MDWACMRGLGAVLSCKAMAYDQQCRQCEANPRWMPDIYTEVRQLKKEIPLCRIDQLRYGCRWRNYLERCPRNARRKAVSKRTFRLVYTEFCQRRLL